MSYILDALKRADAERQRGAVPGLHAQPLTTSNAHASAGAGTRRKTGLVLAVTLALSGIAAGLWGWRAPADPLAPSTPSTPSALSTPLPVATQPVPAPATKAIIKAAASPTTKTTAAALPLLSELPEDLRQQIPKLVISGAVYADNPAKRLLLVNNQVLAQGSVAATDLVLEKIELRNAVFSFRGTRFKLAH